MTRGARFIAIALVLVFAASKAASAQSTSRPGTLSDVVLFAANVGIGALTAGVTRAADQRPVWRGVVQGAVGGGTVYVGKRIVAANFRSTNLIGREIAAIGSSVVTNAAYGRGPLERLILPYGPFRFYINRRGTDRLRVKLDLATSIATAVEAANPNMKFDAARSVASGAAIFVIDSSAPSGDLGGSHYAGVIRTRYQNGDFYTEPAQQRSILGHELVHLSQYDFAFIAWAAPAESYLLRKLPGGKWINGYVDLSLNAPFFSGLNTLIPYDDRPWEREAEILERN